MNKEGKLVYENWNNRTNYEFESFMGIMILAGVYKAQDELIEQLGDKGHRRAILSKSDSQ